MRADCGTAYVARNRRICSYVESPPCLTCREPHQLAPFLDYPEVGIRAILPRLKEAFAAHVKEHTQDTKKAHSFAAEDRRLANVVPSEKHIQNQIQLGVAEENIRKRETESEMITYAYLWPRLSSFFKEGDIIVGDTGTSSFGILDSTLPKNITLVLQGPSLLKVYWRGYY